MEDKEIDDIYIARPPLTNLAVFTVAIFTIVEFLYPTNTALGWLGLSAGAAYGISHFRHFITSGGLGLAYLKIMIIIGWIHTGRHLTSNIYTHLMVLLIIIATMMRGLIPFFEAYTSQLYLWSSILWTVPFMIYIKVFFGFLVAPRADGIKG